MCLSQKTHLPITETVGLVDHIEIQNTFINSANSIQIMFSDNSVKEGGCIFDFTQTLTIIWAKYITLTNGACGLNYAVIKPSCDKYARRYSMRFFYVTILTGKSFRTEAIVVTEYINWLNKRLSTLQVAFGHFSFGNHYILRFL